MQYKFVMFQTQAISPLTFRFAISMYAKIKVLLGMLARLPWGRRDMLSSMNGKDGGVSVKYASLIVARHWIKVFITS